MSKTPVIPHPSTIEKKVDPNKSETDMSPIKWGAAKTTSKKWKSKWNVHVDSSRLMDFVIPNNNWSRWKLSIDKKDGVKRKGDGPNLPWKKRLASHTNVTKVNTSANDFKANMALKHPIGDRTHYSSSTAMEWVDTKSSSHYSNAWKVSSYSQEWTKAWWIEAHNHKYHHENHYSSVSP